MTITINKANKIETTLFEKKMNLHLYIPPCILPTLQDYYLELYTAHSFEFSLFARQKMTRPIARKFSLSDSLPVDTKEMRSDPYFTKQ